MSEHQGCTQTTCESCKHTPECVIEAAETQGWSDAEVVTAAKRFIELRDAPITEQVQE